ncbi:Hydroxysteroid dehydrogenase-like protein 2 [Dirofilaria immitis]|nr:Hydroxysteroid dehydrogenase-like protein 2 [Dirofilaria immitis]
MITTGRFAGRTVIITGASRGIGKEIALKLAKDGANIVVAAKTVEAHPKLPGTIYSAVEDIEKAGDKGLARAVDVRDEESLIKSFSETAGGKGLACAVDVRDEESVTKAVSETVKKFGGIDILINNASAISLTGTLQTTMKKFDLMHQINTRGTFLIEMITITKVPLSKIPFVTKCIPFLKNGRNPHILNISPPLNMAKNGLPIMSLTQIQYLAYTMAKYGMSMCVLGMHEELRPFNIAVNALWPRTAIWTAAMKMISTETARNNCRKPTIMADAAYAILSRDSTQFTGNFIIDDEILREEGIQDFDQYSIEPGATLLEDFFLPDTTETPNSEIDTSILSMDMMINEAKQRITPEIIQKIQAIYQLDVTEGSKIHSIYFNLKNGKGGIYKSLNNSSEYVDVRFITDLQTFYKLFNGKMSATIAVASGKFKIEGNMEKALLFSQFFNQSNKSKL